jgi:holliday junction DNA helicase RuvA
MWPTASAGPRARIWRPAAQPARPAHRRLRPVCPDAAAVEQTFVNKDAVGTLKLGQARGIAMLVPAQAGIAVGEYAPNAVKKAVVGVGHAGKQQIDHMVRMHAAGGGAGRARRGRCAGHRDLPCASPGPCRAACGGRGAGGGMIGRLTGRIGYKGADHVLIDVGGVGYVVHVSDRTRMALPGEGELAMLYTELLVREDLLQLFGFLTPVEKEWHRLLMTVQGIGAKASMAILGTLGAEGVGRAIALGDWSAVKAAPGVGPKIAQRVVNELRDKARGDGDGAGRRPARRAGRARRGRARAVAAPRPAPPRRAPRRRPRRCRRSRTSATARARRLRPWPRRRARRPRRTRPR